MNQTCKICGGTAKGYVQISTSDLTTHNGQTSQTIYLCLEDFEQVKSLTDRIISGELITMLAKVRNKVEFLESENKWLKGE